MNWSLIFHRALVGLFLGGFLSALIDVTRTDAQKRARWKDKLDDPDAVSTDRIAGAVVLLIMAAFLYGAVMS